jgi:hypothetical protein
MVGQHVGKVSHGHRLDKDPHIRILLSRRVPVQPGAAGPAGGGNG